MLARDIEFRGINTKTNEMVYGDLIHGIGPQLGKSYILENKMIYVNDYDIFSECQIYSNSIEVFIGCYDDQGQKIFTECI